jgi:predicted transcriptional regulator
MVLLDDRILELFTESDEDFLTPSEIADHDGINYSSQYVGGRCLELAEHGLLQRVKKGVYRITDEGRGYLTEEYDVQEEAWVEKEEPSADMGAEEGESANGV